MNSHGPYFSRYQSLVTVEPIDSPLSHLKYRNLNDICLKWYGFNHKDLYLFNTHLSKKQLSELSQVSDRICFKGDDLSEEFHDTYFPLVPFKFPDWKTNLPRLKSGEISPKKRAIQAQKIKRDQREAQEKKEKVQAVRKDEDKNYEPHYNRDHLCEDTPIKVMDEKCRNRPLTELGIEDWSKQRPLAYQGDGPHFYMLEYYTTWRERDEDQSQVDQKGLPITHLKRSTARRSFIQFTSIGLVSKFSPKNLDVWAWDMKTGRGIPNTRVELFNVDGQMLQTTKTDEFGIAHFELLKNPLLLNQTSPPSLIIIAEHKGEFASTNTTTQSEWYGYSYPFSWDNIYDSKRGKVWTERGIYRPGESVYIGGFLSELALIGVESVAKQNITLKIQDARYENIATIPLTTTDLGGFSTEFKLPPTASLGTYSVSINWNKKRSNHISRTYTWYTNFKVSEFKTPNFLVNAQKSTGHVIAGDPVDFHVESLYLYGAPMRDKAWRVQVNTQPTRFSPRSSKGEYNGFSFDLSYYQNEERFKEITGEKIDYLSSYFTSKKGTLDTQGKSTVTFTPTAPLGKTVQYLGFFNVTDSDDQTGGASTSVTVHPSSTYIGLKNKAYMQSKEEVLSVDVIAVDALTHKMTSMKDLTVSLHMIQWKTSYIKDEAGRQRARSEHYFVEVGRCQLKIEAGQKETCSFKTSSSGHHIWIAQGADDQKRKSVSMTSLWVYGSGSGSAWQTHDGSDVKINTARDTYAPGEMMDLLIETPFQEAEAWVTVEQGQILYSKQIRYRSGERLQIPVTSEMIPNATVRISLVKGRVEKPGRTGDLGRPVVKYAQFNFKVKADSKRLALRNKKN